MRPNYALYVFDLVSDVMTLPWLSHNLLCCPSSIVPDLCVLISPVSFYPLCVCPYIYMYVAIWGLFSPSIRILDHTPYIIRFASMEWGFYILHKTTSRVFSLFSASSFLRAISAFMMHGKSHDFPSQHNKLWLSQGKVITSDTRSNTYKA